MYGGCVRHQTMGDAVNCLRITRDEYAMRGLAICIECLQVYVNLPTKTVGSVRGDKS
jgi:hypothetical protein